MALTPNTSSGAVIAAVAVALGACSSPPAREMSFQAGMFGELGLTDVERAATVDATPHYSAHLVPSLSAGEPSFPESVDNQGNIIGRSRVVSTGAEPAWHAYLHRAGDANSTDLNASGDELSWPISLTDGAGVVVGFSAPVAAEGTSPVKSPISAPICTIGPGQQSPVVWIDGQMQRVPLLGHFVDVNASGQGVLRARRQEQDAEGAFLWDPRSQTLTSLAPAGARLSRGLAIDDLGNVLVWAVNAGPRLYIWRDGKEQLDLVARGVPDNATHFLLSKNGLFLAATAWDTKPINAEKDENLVARLPFVHALHTEGLTYLPLPPGTKSGLTDAINNSGTVVGACWDPDVDGHRAVVWARGEAGYTAVDLNTMTSLPDGVVLRGARGINDSGVIVAWGIDSAGRVASYKLEPVP